MAIGTTTVQVHSDIEVSLSDETIQNLADTIVERLEDSKFAKNITVNVSNTHSPNDITNFLADTLR